MVCDFPKCEKRLRSDNRSGRCQSHPRDNREYRMAWTKQNRASWSPERQERESVRQAQWRKDNAEDHKAQQATYQQENREAVLVVQARRRARKRGLLISVPTRAEIWARTGGQCHLCLKPVEFDSRWHREHVISLESGGVEHIENLAPAHAKCNMSKGKKSFSSIPWVGSTAWDICAAFHAPDTE